MTQSVEDIYQSIGPCLSSRLQEELKRQGKSPVAARQSISRLNRQFRQIPIVFPHNEKFISSQEDFGTERYLDAVKEAIFNEENGCYALALRALSARGGLMPKQHFLIACGSPLKQSKHPTINDIITRLIDAEIVEEFESDILGSCIKYKECNVGIAEHKVYARVCAEKILIDCVRDWLRNLNIASYGSISTRNDEKLPQIGTFHWDIAGPSYLSSLRTGNTSSDCGFVACDVLLERIINEHDILPFINKIKTLSSLRRIKKCLYVFVAEMYSLEAFQALKAMGVIPATVNNLFGFELAKAMKSLCEVLGSAVNRTDNKGKLKNAFDQIGRIEGAALNLRGALFPFLVAEVLKADSYEILKMNQKITIPNSEKRLEIDIIAKKSNEIYFFECKGEMPESQADDAEISKWITSISHAKKYADNYPEYERKKFHYEFWTSGFYSENALQELSTKKDELRKYSINYKSGRDILKLAKQLSITHVVDTLNEHFFKHPLAQSSTQLTSESSTLTMQTN